MSSLSRQVLLSGHEEDITQDQIPITHVFYTLSAFITHLSLVLLPTTSLTHLTIPTYMFLAYFQILVFLPLNYNLVLLYVKCHLMEKSTGSHQWVQVKSYMCRWTGGWALGLSCSCRVKQWPCVEFMSCVGGSDRQRFVCLCLGWPALSNPPHLDFVCSFWVHVSLVWLALCVKGTWTAWPAGCLQPHWLYVSYVQLSVQASSRCNSWNTEEREGKVRARFPLLMKNTLRISQKKSLFHLFPPCFLLLCFVFF